jgi:hypothetical protein
MDPNEARSASADGARQAAWLFIAAGLIGLANDWLLASTFGKGTLFAVALDVLNVAIGVSAVHPVDPLAPSGCAHPADNRSRQPVGQHCQ